MKIKIFLVILVFGIFFVMSINFVFGDSDFILELKDVNKQQPTIVKLELDGESSMQICPSGKCEIQVINSSFSPPNLDNNMTIAHSIDFNVKYNITDANVGSNQKKSLEKFREDMNRCLINDIIKDKEREIYFCSNGVDLINRDSDSKSWYYDSIGIYDAINNTYIVKGDFKSDPPE